MNITISIDETSGRGLAHCEIEGRKFTIRRSLIDGSTRLDGVEAPKETENTFAGMIAHELMRVLDKVFDARGVLGDYAVDLSDPWAQLEEKVAEDVYEAMV